MQPLRSAPPLAALCLAAAGCSGAPADGGTPPSVVASPPSVTMMVGMQTSIRATVAGASTAPRLEWRSLAPEVATAETMYAPGDAGAAPTAALVRGVGVGTTAIVVSLVGRPESADTVSVAVAPPPCLLVGMLVEPEAATLAVGDTLRFRARVFPCNRPPGDTSVTWRSLGPAVAAVDSTGLVTALAPGQATLVANARSTPANAAAVTVTVVPERPRR